MVAAGKVVMVTGAVAVTMPQPPAAAIVQVTVQLPAVLVLGVIAPVDGSMVKPEGQAV